MMHNSPPRRKNLDYIMHNCIEELCHAILEQSMNRSTELIPALEEVDFEYEEISDQIPAEHFDKFSSGCGRPTSCDYIIYHQHLLALLDSIALNLKEILSILLIEARLVRLARQLPLLPDRRESSSEAQRQTWAEQKAPCIESHYDIWFDAISECEDLQLEGSDQLFVYRVGCEEREDVDKVDAFDREVGEVS